MSTVFKFYDFGGDIYMKEVDKGEALRRVMSSAM
jgi:hypothetical protein